MLPQGEGGRQGVWREAVDPDLAGKIPEPLTSPLLSLSALWAFTLLRLVLGETCFFNFIEE